MSEENCKSQGFCLYSTLNGEENRPHPESSSYVDHKERAQRWTVAETSVQTCLYYLGFANIYQNLKKKKKKKILLWRNVKH